MKRPTGLELGIVAGFVAATILMMSSYFPNKSIKEGIVNSGPYTGTHYKISETKKNREIILTNESNVIGLERIYLRAIDQGKDGIYESIETKLEGKETSRNLGHIPTDLAKIIAETNSNK